MTYRVYVRWPGQVVTNRTSTDSLEIAETAFQEIVDNSAQFVKAGALGASFTHNGRQKQYCNFTDNPPPPPTQTAA